MPRPRRILEWTILAVILAVGARFFFGQWQVVVSGSMANTLVGPHYDVTCTDCGLKFACDADTPPLVQAVCPNCGFANARPDEIAGGTQLWVDRAGFYWHMPQRWEVAVFHAPDSGEPAVKRIVGLPGEAIEVRDGEVFADGQLVRKTLDQTRPLAVLVHDTAFSPGRLAPVPARWMASNTSAWRHNAGQFTFASNESREIDWLEYRHWQRLPTRPDQVEEIPIRDEDAYNAGRSRRLNDVFDLLLACRLKATGPGQLLLRATDGRQWFEVSIEPATGHLVLFREGGQALRSLTLPAPLLARQTTVEFALVDEQVILALDGVVQLDYPCEPDDAPQRPTARPVAIGARGLSVEIARLQLSRDVYYTDPPMNRLPQWRIVQLGAEEYFVLGDNSPVSNDSRTWPDSPALPARCLIGKPLGIR